MADITAIKTATDVAITDKVIADSIDPADVGGRINAVTDELRPYKVYTALILQVTTGAPTVKILENSIGTIVWTRTGVGAYEGTLTGAFTADKTWGIVVNGGAAIENVDFALIRVSANVLELKTWDSGALNDSILTNTPIEIRVYY